MSALTESKAFRQAEAWRKADPCVYCGRPSGCWEHADPLSLGGEDAPDNTVRACDRCNGRKGQRSALLYLLHRLSIHDERNRRYLEEYEGYGYNSNRAKPRRIKTRHVPRGTSVPMTR